MISISPLLPSLCTRRRTQGSTLPAAPSVHKHFYRLRKPCILLVHIQSMLTLCHENGAFCWKFYRHLYRNTSEWIHSVGCVCGMYFFQSVCSSIEAQGDRELYNFHWDDCGPIPAECDRYLKFESCFYECDPYIKQWQDPVRPWAVLRVPICAR